MTVDQTTEESLRAGARAPQAEKSSPANAKAPAGPQGSGTAAAPRRAQGTTADALRQFLKESDRA